MTDFKDLNNQAMPYIELLFSYLNIDTKLVGNELQFINPLRNDTDFGSASINVETGMWADFAETDDPKAKGGDLISLVAYLTDTSQSLAAKNIQALLSEPTHQAVDVLGVVEVIDSVDTQIHKVINGVSYERVYPVHDNSPFLPRDFGDVLGEPSGIYPYRNEQGVLLGYIMRFDLFSGKTIRPATLWKDETDRYRWLLQGFPEPRPLYNLHLLAQKPDAPVLIVEGEKSANAASELFPDHVVVTTMHGAKSPEKSDLTPLQGRSVLIWPDFDEPGKSYAETMAKLLSLQDDTAIVNIMKPITVSAAYDLSKNPMLKPRFVPSEGWDAADALAEGWTAAHIKLLPDEVWQELQAKTGEYLADGSFYKDVTGVYEVKLSEGGHQYKVLICSSLTINALSRDQANTNWGIVLEFKDADHHTHKWCMPKEMLASGNTYRQALLNMGLDIEVGNGTKDSLAAYIQAIKPTQRALSVTKPGWYKNVFVFPDKVVGNGNETVVLNTNDPKGAAIFRQRGSFEAWKSEVAALCIGNSRLVLSMCIGLSGPFLYHLGTENGGFHFQGESSTGKTTAGMIAASVWADHSSFIKTWRTTGNALEAEAARHNDTMMILDELAEVHPQEAGNIAYMLGNGQGKGRANRNGMAKDVATWRLLFLSTGEISLADHIASSGGRVTAGQEVRVINIVSNAGARMGIFESIHGVESPQLFAARIKDLTLEHCGHAGPAIIDLLLEQDSLASLIRAVRTAIDQFTNTNVPSNASGQVHRVAKRFGLLAAVGELAIERGILPWPTGEATQGVLSCFQAWLEARGGIHDSESEQAIATVRQFLEMHGESRFSAWTSDLVGDYEVRTINRAGFRKATDDGRNDFYVFPDVWKSDVCRGLNSRQVTKAMVEKGYILTANDGKSTQSIRLPGLGLKRVYVISPDILGLTS